MPDDSLRCPYCVGHVPRKSWGERLRGLFSRSARCPRCRRKFNRAMGLHVAVLYNRIVSDFEDRLFAELRKLPVVDRAGVLVDFGMHMEDAKVASSHMLVRNLHQVLEPQLTGLARGYEGHLDLHRREKGKLAVLDVDAMVEDGSHSRRRLRIARIEPKGFIEVDLNSVK